MATSDLDDLGKPKFDPNYFEPPRERGCFFYGCLFAAVVAVLIMVALGALFFVSFRWAGRQIQEYTALAPVALPKVQIADEDRRTLDERIAAFRKALDEASPTAPLVLTSNDLNALIESNQALAGKIYVTVEEDKIKGQVSYPLEEFAVWPFEDMLKGRYLNGEAEIKVSLENGVLLVLLDSFAVNGKRPPEPALERLRQQNLTQDAYKDPKNAEQIRKLESIVVKNGKIIITARAGREGPKAGSEKLPDQVIAPLDEPKSKLDNPAPTAATQARGGSKEPAKADVKKD